MYSSWSLDLTVPLIPRCRIVLLYLLYQMRVTFGQKNEFTTEKSFSGLGLKLSRWPPAYWVLSESLQFIFARLPSILCNVHFYLFLPVVASSRGEMLRAGYGGKVRPKQNALSTTASMAVVGLAVRFRRPGGGPIG